MRTPLLVLLLAGLAVPPAAAQQPSIAAASGDTVRVDIDAGSVSTVLIRVPPAAGAEEATYSIAVAEGARVFTAPRGVVRWSDGEDAALALTFAVPRSAPAGRFPVATVTVTRPGGSWRTEVDAHVRAHRSLAVTFSADHFAMPRGGERRIDAIVTNGGNVSDTVSLALELPIRWTLIEPLPAAVLAPGASLTVPLHVRAPADAQLGASQVLVLMLDGQRDASAVTTAHLVDPRSASAGYVTLPGTLFVGASDIGTTGGGVEQPDVALALAGAILPDTDLAIAIRHVGSSWTGTALRRELAGPSLRADLSRPGIRVSGGDVYLAASPLTGGFLQGTGAVADVELGAVRAEVLAGRPGAGGGVLPGHLGRLRLSSPVGFGTASIALVDLDRPADGSGLGRTQSVLGGYTLSPAFGHEAAIEVGGMRLTDVHGTTRTGAAAQGEYRIDRDPFNAQVRARLVPATLPGSPIGNELFASAGRRLTQRFSLSAWSYTTSTEALTGDGLRFTSGALSARYAPSRVLLQLTPSLARTRGGGGLLSDSDQASLAAGVYLPLGALQLDVSAEATRVHAAAIDGTTTFAAARLGWNFDGGWLALGAAHQQALLGHDAVRVDVSGMRRLGRFEGEGGFGIDIDERAARERGRGWLGLSADVFEGTRLVLGLDYQPWRGNASALRSSFGMRRSLAPPLPLRRQPFVHGVIFDDRNANGTPDAGEPGIAGVIVRRGHAQVVTDEAGRYAFFDAAPGAALQVDARSVDHGLLLPAGEPRSARGRVDFGLIRTATLRVDLFIDRTGTGTPVPGDAGPGGVRVSLIDTRGIERGTTSGDDGIARFGALRPGTYTIRVFPSGDGAAGLDPLDVEVTLTAGEIRTVSVAAPYRAREIRFRGASGGV